tara:strand:- start:17 stop:778 length:762 start_codon:yes stop_codon:yes gene_type:complete
MFFSKKLQKFKNLKHCFFSRKGGYSSGLYKSLNCGMGSKDRKDDVLKNLEHISSKIGCEKEKLVTLNQTHSNDVIFFENSFEIKNKIPGDAIVTKIKKVGIGVLTADCVPVLLYDPQKKIIGSIHSGWKGAFNGVIRNTIKKFTDLESDLKETVAVIGPCIHKKNYEVKADLYEKFIEQNSNYKNFFEKAHSDKFLFDLRGLVNKQINDLGIKNIENIEMDTFSQKDLFYSYRRSRIKKEKDYGRCISVILMT